MQIIVIETEHETWIGQFDADITVLQEIPRAIYLQNALKCTEPYSMGDRTAKPWPGAGLSRTGKEHNCVVKSPVAGVLVSDIAKMYMTTTNAEDWYYNHLNKIGWVI